MYVNKLSNIYRTIKKLKTKYNMIFPYFIKYNKYTQKLIYIFLYK